MKWITRERPKIDRLACPWLIRRFIDANAEIIYVPEQLVLAQAEAMQAVPFDVADVEFSHYEDKCTFDYFLHKYDLKDPALQIMALIVRGADTDNHGIASQASGLWAISAGLAYNIKDDYELLEKAMVIYDALYTWAKHLQNVKHTQNPSENLLIKAFHQYLELSKQTNKRIPEWAQQLKETIQDQIDTNLTLSLKDVSEELNVHPAYLSRQFSKYFDNLSFGDYIRKLRIEKSIHLLEHTSHSLTEIAYLTGFSDQSHFSRIFKKQTGQNPSDFKKELAKGKKNTKGK